MDTSVEVDAVVFDVFGTVVDWRSTIVAEGTALAEAHGLEVDWPSFADQWRREGYLEPIQSIVAGERPWVDIDTVLGDHLVRLAADYGFGTLGAEVLARLASVWERLEPWSDVAAGLGLLRARYVIGPLSNGTFATLTRMGRHAGLGWDCIIATELFGTFKPDPQAYRGAAKLLGLDPGRVMLVAAHPSDLRAARDCGLRTAYVPRPLEWGANEGGSLSDAPDVDVVANDFVALAEALGATATAPGKSAWSPLLDTEHHAAPGWERLTSCR